MERSEVYQAIDSEREYQESMKKNLSRPDIIQDFHTGDTLAAIQYNFNKAVDAWYKNPTPHIEAMEYIRKIAALCVQLGESNGMLPR